MIIILLFGMYTIINIAGRDLRIFTDKSFKNYKYNHIPFMWMFKK